MRRDLLGAMSAIVLMAGPAAAQPLAGDATGAADATVGQPPASMPSSDAEREVRRADGASNRMEIGDDRGTGADATTRDDGGATLLSGAPPVKPDAPAAGAPRGIASVDELVGKTVVDGNDETLGEVEDVILAPDGQAQRIVLSRGGLLGIGEKQVAIDFAQIETRSDSDDLYASGLTRDQVKGMPEFQYDDSMASLNRDRQAGTDDHPTGPADPR
ncbi:PRC-barrel domain-containing protein [Azospirillum sp. ST 5-10]|uniref:PRC-barrel domain-containing protein n=1 Tax=unclassified Azospirillum TaxID=2630922 RepID=UPI003F4A34B6